MCLPLGGDCAIIMFTLSQGWFSWCLPKQKTNSNAYLSNNNLIGMPYCAININKPLWICYSFIMNILYASKGTIIDELQWIKGAFQLDYLFSSNRLTTGGLGVEYQPNKNFTLLLFVATLKKTPSTECRLADFFNITSRYCVSWCAVPLACTWSLLSLLLFTIT